MIAKERTWPSAVVDAENGNGWNVRRLDGLLVFSLPVDRRVAQEARDAMNQSFDWGQQTKGPKL